MNDEVASSRLAGSPARVAMAWTNRRHRRHLRSPGLDAKRTPENALVAPHGTRSELDAKAGPPRSTFASPFCGPLGAGLRLRRLPYGIMNARGSLRPRRSKSASRVIPTITERA
jgi:hypothetical protein